MSEATHGQADYDLIVVGLGAMGAATLFHARRQGLHVLGIDRYNPPHDLGSSHAETRITRLAVGEGEQYLPFAARSHEIWRELEALAGEELLYQSGGCIISKPDSSSEQRWSDFVSATGDVAAAGGIEFDRLTPDQLRQAHPAIKVADSDNVGIEPTAGVVMSERAIEVQLRLAAELGAEIHTDEAVTAVNADSDQVTVDTVLGTYSAKNVVLAAGPWMPGFTSVADRKQLAVTRQVVYCAET